MKMTQQLGIILTTIAIAGTTVIAHPGRLDGSQGHKDNKNASGLGTYHYHCNKSDAHLHTNGACSYRSGSTSSTSTSTKANNAAAKGTATKTFIIDGEEKQIGTVTRNNVTLVELRTLCDALGIAVNYDPTTKRVSGTKGDANFSLHIGSKTFFNGAENTELLTEPISLDGKTMIPARVIAETIGKVVVFHSAADTIEIK